MIKGKFVAQNELKPCPFCGEKYTVNLSDCSEYITHWMPLPEPPKEV